MDYFAHQDQARRKTTLILFYFIAAIAATITLLYGVLVLALPLSGVTLFVTSNHGELWQPDLLLWTALGTLGFILIGSVYKTLTLGRSPGFVIARSLGGKQVQSDSHDPLQRRLINVIEEMAIASGMPPPGIFILPESSINAFAAGTGPGNAVIAVTQGTLELLNRDELQGVVAHEFSHIFNGDMRLNIRLLGLLHGLLLIALSGEALLRGGTRPRHRIHQRGQKQGGSPAILGLGLMAAGYIGVLFGNLIKAAVSRQREYLADASAVQFTRNKDGIGGALKKIGGFVEGSLIQHPKGSEASHLYFSTGRKFSDVFATHPPIEKRVRRIYPRFNGRFKPISHEAAQSLAEQQRHAAIDNPLNHGAPVAAHFTSAGNTPGQHTASGVSSLPDAITLVASVGAPQASQLQYARELLHGLAEPLRQAAHNSHAARALVYGLLIHNKNDKSLVKLLEQRADPDVYQELLRLYTQLHKLPQALRLPLLELCLPALRQLSTPQYKVFRANLKVMIRADGALDPLEFTIEQVIIARLDRDFDILLPVREKHTRVKHILGPAILCLSAIAHHAGPGAEQAAWAAGLRALGLPPGTPLMPRHLCTHQTLSNQFERLVESSPRLKQKLLEAFIASIAEDQRILVEEAEMLAALAGGLDLPLPPILCPAPDTSASTQ